MKFFVMPLLASLIMLLPGCEVGHAANVVEKIGVHKVICASDVVDAWPHDAYLLPADKAGQLQSALNRYKSVRLEAFGDYTKRGGPTYIKLSGGQKLYGLLGTKIGHVLVEGGSTNAVLQGVMTDGIEFLPSNEVTRANCFRRISGEITVKGAKLEDNLFVDLSGSPLDIDTRMSGYMRNNRFIRTMVHGTSPALHMYGDSDHSSANNVFLWLNLLTPHGDGIEIDNQKDISFVGLDAESWNWSKRAKNQAMMTVRSTGSLRVVAANGGDPKSRSGRYFDIEAEEFQMIGSRVGPVGNPAITLRPGLKRSAFIDVENLGVNDKATGGFQLNAFSLGSSVVKINDSDARDVLIGGDAASALKQTFVDPQRSGRPWEQTVLPPIPDPAGPDWQVNLKNKPDSTDYIQGLIDSRGVAYLPAGIYYISRPIKLGDKQGIVGAGASRTAIIAKYRTVNIVVATQHIKTPASTTFMIADVTLQGGRNGIVHDADGAGDGAQFNMMYLSHVTFRDMSEAGILVNGIYGWDNNFIDNVNFYRCAKAGIKQRVANPWLPGDRPGMTYMDKNMFYRCQFVENGSGVDFEAVRADNLNAFVGCVFRDNEDYAVRLRNNNSTIFADVQFLNNGGDPVIISNKPAFFIDAYFYTDRRGKALLPSGATCEGCEFEQKGAGEAVIHSGGGRLFLLNSRSINMKLGSPDSGIFINSLFPQDPVFSQQATLLLDGSPHIVVPGQAHPAPQLLFGSDFGN